MDADHDEEETNADVDSESVDGTDEAQTAGPVILTEVSKTRIEAQRLLTAEDFALIAKLKAAQAARIRDPRSRKRAHEESANDGDNLFGDEDNEAKVELPDFAVDPEALGPGMRTKKATKIEKITKILEGRKDSKFDLGGHGGGLTNKEKERKKNFVMVRKGKRSVASKINKSNSDKRYEKMVHVRPQLFFYFFVVKMSVYRESNSAEKSEREEEHERIDYRTVHILCCLYYYKVRWAVSSRSNMIFRICQQQRQALFNYSRGTIFWSLSTWWCI
jgi:hypothetical protein